MVILIDKVEMIPSTAFSFDSNSFELSISDPAVLPGKYTLTFNVWLKGAVNPITVTLSVTVVE